MLGSIRRVASTIARLRSLSAWNRMLTDGGERLRAPAANVRKRQVSSPLMKELFVQILPVLHVCFGPLRPCERGRKRQPHKPAPASRRESSVGSSPATPRRGTRRQSNRARHGCRQRSSLRFVARRTRPPYLLVYLAKPAPVRTMPRSRVSPGARNVRSISMARVPPVAGGDSRV